MTELPQPLTSADCDCTDLDGFMLNVERLMSSELVALSTHEEIGVALLLWCRAWKQRPAASLPNDDRVNAAFAKISEKKFKKIKNAALRGFVLCCDNRLYHRVLAAEAMKAWERKIAYKNKRLADNDRLRRWRDGQRRNAFHTRDETGFETRSEREGQGQGQVNRKNLPSVDKKVRSTKNSRSADLPERFEEFWAIYPLRKDKGHAIKAYSAALKKVPAQKIIDGAKTYAAERKGENSQFTKHASTWLNGECWHDEPSKVVESSVFFSYDDERKRNLRVFLERGFWLSTEGPPPLDRNGDFNHECCYPAKLLAEFGIVPGYRRDADAPSH